MSDYTFPEIDTSYWKLNDKAWVAERKAKWATIEPMFKDGASKSKKGLSIIKKYFLKGIMPDFKALQDWNNMERHLDLLCFLWLHPSSDEDILRDLRMAYFYSPIINRSDIDAGLSIMKAYTTVYPSSEYPEEEYSKMVNFEGKERLLFDVLFSCEGDLNNLDDFDVSLGNWKDGYPSLMQMSRWLMSDNLNSYSKQCIYDYDPYLDFWYVCCSSAPGFFSKPKNKLIIPSLKKSLFRINYFDMDAEGDSPRSRFVIKIRKILDEREFIQDFKQMWLGVKSGEIVIENAWDK